MTALKNLNELGVIHRDIRWPNIIKYANRTAWFLIDFDDAAVKPTQAATHLDPAFHAPEIKTDGHTEAVDMSLIEKFEKEKPLLNGGVLTNE